MFFSLSAKAHVKSISTSCPSIELIFQIHWIAISSWDMQEFVHCFWHANRLCHTTQSSELTNLVVLRGLLLLLNLYCANDNSSRLDNWHTGMPKIQCLRKETVFTTSVFCWRPPQSFVTTNPFVVIAGSSQRTKAHKNYKNSDFI